METAPSEAQKPHVTVFFLIFFLLVICYSNSFRASWQLDDKPNIVNNRRLHIDNLMPESLWGTFHAKPGGNQSIYRPISNCSLALNWYLGKMNPLGYHVVNFAIHLATSVILYATFLLIFSTPLMAGHFTDRGGYFVAILGAILWAVNPIHTQAVTYIVQRMAILAALFYLLGIYLYLKGRLCQDRYKRIFYFIGCLLSYLLAVGSKENAIMLPVCLLVMEWFFFIGNYKTHFNRVRILWTVGALLLFGGCASLIIETFDGFDFLLRGYENRPFSMPERVMSEAGIVLWYLSMIFYPSPHRLSVAHDINLSTSLVSPWTTIVALTAIVSLIVLALLRAKKNRLLSFAILFFLINHVIESSILPLELIFEHRNYLPSLFLFLPVAAGIHTLLNRCSHYSKTAHHLIVALIPIIIIAMGWSTYFRNSVWRTEITLWEDAMLKAPNNARPFTSLAGVISEQNSPSPNDLDRALGLYFNGLQKYKSRTDIEPGIIGNMASIYVKKQDLNTAMELYRKALERDPEYIYAIYNLSALLSATGNLDEAGRIIDTILNKGYVHEDYYNLKGTILMWQQQPKAALDQFRCAFRLTETKAKPFIGIGSALCAMGHHRQAAWFLRLAHNAQPDSIVTLFLLIENALNADNPVEIEKWTQRLLNDHSLPTIEKWLDMLPTFYKMPPVSVDRVAATIYARASVLPVTIKPMK
jgi:tetratricopeptide (TPR) repeat protein